MSPVTSRILLALYWTAIFVGTHLPKSSMPTLAASDKIYHAGAFAGLAFLLSLSLPTTWTWLRKCVVVLVAGISYAVFDELTQNLVAGREADVLDAFADAFGIALGFLTYTCWTKVRGGTRNSSDS